VDALIGGVIGLAIGLIGSFIAPAREQMARLGRRLLRAQPVDVHVEKDLDRIYAGIPDWVSATFFLPEQSPNGDPGSSVGEWQRWVAERGGWDVGVTTLRVTIVARSPATVVVFPPQVSAQMATPPSGTTIWRPVGGASVNLLGLDVRLQPGRCETLISDNDGSVNGPLSWSLRDGEAQQFLIRIQVGDEALWTWAATLELLIYGRLLQIDLPRSEGGNRLVGSGLGGKPQTWTGAAWS